MAMKRLFFRFTIICWNYSRFILARLSKRLSCQVVLPLTSYFSCSFFNGFFARTIPL